MCWDSCSTALLFYLPLPTFLPQQIHEKPWQRLHFCALLALMVIKFWQILSIILSWRNWRFLYCLGAKLEKAVFRLSFYQKTPKADGQVNKTQQSASHCRAAKRISLWTFHSALTGRVFWRTCTRHKTGACISLSVDHLAAVQLAVLFSEGDVFQ